MSEASPAGDYRFCALCAGTLESRLVKEGEPPRLVCARCGFVFYLDPKVAACAICMVDGGIVLLRRAIEPSLGKWVFPGGFVDRGETVSGAAVRETLEEVNLRVSPTGILDAYSYPGSQVVVIVYAAEVVGGELQACDECLEVRAFPPEEIPWDDLAFESTRAALRDYLRRFFPRARLPR
ncbi:MAG TPA: NUDIX hydrolase [Vicinamibacteria bacterium]|nr:NUDIX hydrolase [Vicinamibacteria bacterium]